MPLAVYISASNGLVQEYIQLSKWSDADVTLAAIAAVMASSAFDPSSPRSNHLGTISLLYKCVSLVERGQVAEAYVKSDAMQA